jgi:hypothetical protein
MAYIGLQPQTRFLGTSTQLLSGNGVDFEYSLNRGVSKAADLRVFVGGAALEPEIDYTATGTTLLFATQPASGTDNISISYVSGALTSITLTSDSFPQGSTVNPSIRYVDATSTGIHFPTTSAIGLTVSGNTRVRIDDAATASSTTTGALRVSGGAGITGALYVGSGVRFTSTAESSTSADGALVVSGGVGVAKSLNVQGSLNVAGDFTVAGQFTTTGADSLVLNDPFVFLANANPGDSLDSGLISSYTDQGDSTVKYTGIFRDVTDGRYKLFDKLTSQPTTTVNTGAASFRFGELWVSNLQVRANTLSSSSTTGAMVVYGGLGVLDQIFVNADNNEVAIGNGGTNGVGNIGASGTSFNTAFVRATSAQYADVAERYLADAAYAPGTVLHFGGEAEVSQCNVDHCTRVAGVVSTNPAYIMNDTLIGEYVVDLALLGRVPCQVQGPVKRGDMMVSAGNGRARAESNPRLGGVIGKALQDFDGTEGVIEVVVGRI